MKNKFKKTLTLFQILMFIKRVSALSCTLENIAEKALEHKKDQKWQVLVSDADAKIELDRTARQNGEKVCHAICGQYKASVYLVRNGIFTGSDIGKAYFSGQAAQRKGNQVIFTRIGPKDPGPVDTPIGTIPTCDKKTGKDCRVKMAMAMADSSTSTFKYDDTEPCKFWNYEVECARSDSYGRGAGKPMKCAPGEEMNGLLCYPKCRSGYYGVGPVCWGRCPSNFNDHGAFCAKPNSYGRGGGYGFWYSKSYCDRKHRSVGGCEYWGAFKYPKCRRGFYAFGCCVCSPKCPNGMTDIGVSCAKKSYGRGAGKPIRRCPGQNQEKSGLLCYPKGRAGYACAGPMCHGWKCPSASKTECYRKCLEFPDTCDKIGSDRLGC